MCKHGKEHRNKNNRCKICIKNRVAEWRRRKKKELIQMFGGKCKLCGYNKCHRALHFHHLDPDKKSFGISEKGSTHSWDKMVEESKKCVLLCSNCHAEVESGLSYV